MMIGAVRFPPSSHARARGGILPCGDLAAHIAGRERCDADARWEELQPSYEALASKLG
jgi:hypothetical protein